MLSPGSKLISTKVKISFWDLHLGESFCSFPTDDTFSLPTDGGNTFQADTGPEHMEKEKSSCCQTEEDTEEKGENCFPAFLTTYKKRH